MEIADTKEYSDADLLAFAAMLASKLRLDLDRETVEKIITEFQDFRDHRACIEKLFNKINEIEDENRLKAQQDKLQADLLKFKYASGNAGDRYLEQERIRQESKRLKAEYDFQTDALRFPPKLKL